MTPLWKMRSGKFAGFRLNDGLYDPQGESIGYFDDHIAYALGLNGDYVSGNLNNIGVNLTHCCLIPFLSAALEMNPPTPLLLLLGFHSFGVGTE